MKKTNLLFSLTLIFALNAQEISFEDLYQQIEALTTENVALKIDDLSNIINSLFTQSNNEIINSTKALGKIATQIAALKQKLLSPSITNEEEKQLQQQLIQANAEKISINSKQDEAIKNQSSIKTLQDYINKLQSMIQAGNATKVNLALNNLKRFADTLKQNELNLELEQNFTKDRAIFTKSIESTQAYKEFTNLVDQFSQQSGTIRSNDLSNLLTKLDGLEKAIIAKLNAAETLKLFIEKNPDFKNRIKNFDIKYNRLLLTEDELNDFKTKITDQINNLNNRSFIDKLLDPIKEFFGIGNSARSTIIKELKAQYKNYNKQLQGISEATLQNIDLELDKIQQKFTQNEISKLFMNAGGKIIVEGQDGKFYDSDKNLLDQKPDGYDIEIPIEGLYQKME